MKSNFYFIKCILSNFIKQEYTFFAIFLIFMLFFSSCNQFQITQKSTEKLKPFGSMEMQLVGEHIQITNTTLDTIFATDSRFSIKNGIFFYNNAPFSGVLKKYYPRVKMTTYTSVYKGKRYGTYNSFYKSGQPYEIKNYQNNRVTGKHLMYWSNGNLKANYNYEDGIRQGIQKRWYDNGNPYAVFNYIDGKREGEQKAWRASGKIYINNEIVNGRTYGLNRAALCYNVKNEKPVVLGYTEVSTSKENKK